MMTTRRSRDLDQVRTWAALAARAADTKKATSTVVLEVGPILAITDAFVITSGSNVRLVRTIAEEVERQVKAVVDEIEDRLRDLGAKPIRREGTEEGRWVLLDFGDIVVHVQHEEERIYYALERLWKDCPVIPFVDADRVRASERAASSG